MSEETEVKEVEMLIKCDLKTGNVSVACPRLGDKIFCYGLLESAKLAVIQSQLQAQPQHKVVIQPAKGGIVNFIRSNKKRF